MQAPVEPVIKQTRGGLRECFSLINWISIHST